MKPVILLILGLSNGQTVKTYMTLEGFSQLRLQAAHAMRQIYGIELRTL